MDIQTLYFSLDRVVLPRPLQTYERIGKDGELDARLSEVETRIAELAPIVDEAEIKKKQAAAIKYITATVFYVYGQLGEFLRVFVTISQWILEIIGMIITMVIPIPRRHVFL